VRLVLPATALGLTLALAGCDQLAPLFKKEPTREELFVLKLSQGEAAAQAGNFDEAIARYKEASGFSASNTTPTKALGKLYERIGDSRQALLTLRQILVYTPDDLDVQKQLADLYTLDGNDEAAAKQLRTLVDASPGEPDLGLVRQLASALIRTRQLEEALPLVTRIEDVAPGAADAIGLRAEFALAEGDEDEGARLLDEAVRAGESSIYVRLLRGRYFLARGNAEAARDELAIATGLAPDNPEIVRLHANALYLLERYAEASALLADLLQSRPRDLKLRGLLAEVKLAEESAADALTLAESILSAAPNDPQALFLRARAIELSNPDSLMPAIGAYRQLLTQHPSHMPTLHRLWKLLIDIGEKTEALTTLERLLTLERTTSEEDIALAELYIETALNLPRAQKLIEAALKDNPGDEELLALHQQLKARLKEVPPRRSGPGRSGIQILRGGR
jgi:tetratricopeptide (TPR) repeat protein